MKTNIAKADIKAVLGKPIEEKKVGLLQIRVPPDEFGEFKEIAARVGKPVKSILNDYIDLVIERARRRK